MKGKTLLAVLVITVCFSIGYLTYFGATLFVDFLKSQVETCNKSMNQCQQQEKNPLKY
jgi:hypothetical protein